MKIGADTAENDQKFAQNMQTISNYLTGPLPYGTEVAGHAGRSDGKRLLARLGATRGQRRNVNFSEEDRRRLLEENEPKRFDSRSGSIRAESGTGEAGSENDVQYR